MPEMTNYDKCKPVCTINVTINELKALRDMHAIDYQADYAHYMCLLGQVRAAKSDPHMYDLRMEMYDDLLAYHSKMEQTYATLIDTAVKKHFKKSSGRYEWNAKED